MGRYDMIAFVVLVVMIASVVRAYIGRGHRRGGARESHAEPQETRQLRDEVQQLKQRIAVLERIAVEKENSLTREIESLRDHA
jgi:hypothetical protein